MTDSPLLPLDRWKPWNRKLPYGKIGVGYVVDSLDPHNIIPDPSQILYVEQAFDYLDKGSSLRETSEWLSQKLLRPVSHQTVSNLYKLHRKPYLRTKTNRQILNKKIVRTKESLEKAAAKRALTNARKKYERLKTEPQRKIPAEEFPEGPTHRKEPYRGGNGFMEGREPSNKPKNTDIDLVFVPNEGPQTEFLAATELEVLYGGAAGGEPMTWFFRLLSK